MSNTRHPLDAWVKGNTIMVGALISLIAYIWQNDHNDLRATIKDVQNIKVMLHIESNAPKDNSDSQMSCVYQPADLPKNNLSSFLKEQNNEE
jgi:hypothetical protein